MCYYNGQITDFEESSVTLRFHKNAETVPKQPAKLNYLHPALLTQSRGGNKHFYKIIFFVLDNLH